MTCTITKILFGEVFMCWIVSKLNYKHTIFILLTLLFTMVIERDIVSASERQKVGSTESVIKSVFEKKRNASITLGDDIKYLDLITTGTASFTKIKLLDSSVINLGPDSELLIDDFVYDPKASEVSGTITLVRGFLNFVGSKKQKSLKFYSSGSILGIRGTNFDLHTSEKGRISIAVYEGSVMLSNKSDEIFSLEPNSVTILSEKTQKPLIDEQEFESFKKTHRALSKLADKSNFKFRDDIKTADRIVSEIDSFKFQEGAKFLGKVSLKKDNNKSKALRLYFVDQVLKDKKIDLNVLTNKQLSKFAVNVNSQPTKKKEVEKTKKQEKSFSDAFREARKNQGAGGKFTYKGKSYSTDLPSDKKERLSETNNKSESGVNRSVNTSGSLEGKKQPEKKGSYLPNRKGLDKPTTTCFGCAPGYNQDGSKETDIFGNKMSFGDDGNKKGGPGKSGGNKKGGGPKK